PAFNRDILVLVTLRVPFLGDGSAEGLPSRTRSACWATKYIRHRGLTGRRIAAVIGPQALHAQALQDHFGNFDFTCNQDVTGETTSTNDLLATTKSPLKPTNCQPLKLDFICNLLLGSKLREMGRTPANICDRPFVPEGCSSPGHHWSTCSFSARGDGIFHLVANPDSG